MNTCAYVSKHPSSTSWHSARACKPHDPVTTAVISDNDDSDEPPPVLIASSDEQSDAQGQPTRSNCQVNDLDEQQQYSSWTLDANTRDDALPEHRQPTSASPVPSAISTPPTVETGEVTLLVDPHANFYNVLERICTEVEALDREEADREERDRSLRETARLAADAADAAELRQQRCDDFFSDSEADSDQGGNEPMEINEADDADNRWARCHDVNQPAVQHWQAPPSAPSSDRNNPTSGQSSPPIEMQRWATAQMPPGPESGPIMMRFAGTQAGPGPPMIAAEQFQFTGELKFRFKFALAGHDARAAASSESPPSGSQ